MSTLSVIECLQGSTTWILPQTNMFYAMATLMPLFFFFLSRKVRVNEKYIEAMFPYSI